MREIKFRTWISDKKQMSQPFDLHDIQLEEDNFSGFVSFMGKETYPVMQFTGLKDKNGKEIYEGDIVAHKEAGYVNAVVWDQDLAKFTLDDWHVDWHDPEEREPFEIIGNIYENPELLEG